MRFEHLYYSVWTSTYVIVMQVWSGGETQAEWLSDLKKRKRQDAKCKKQDAELTKNRCNKVDYNAVLVGLNSSFLCSVKWSWAAALCNLICFVPKNNSLIMGGCIWTWPCHLEAIRKVEVESQQRLNSQFERSISWLWCGSSAVRSVICFVPNCNSHFEAMHLIMTLSLGGYTENRGGRQIWNWR